MHRKQSRFPWSPGGAARRDRLHAAAKAKKNQQLSEGRGVKGCQNSDNLIERVKTLCQNSDKARVLLTRAGAAIFIGFGHLSKSDNRLLARAGVGTHALSEF